MDFFINEIIEREDVREILRTDPDGLLPQAKLLAEEFIRTGTCDMPKGGTLPLFVCALVADHTLEINSNRGIPREITVTTLRDVNLWIGNHVKQFGTVGLREFSWTCFQLRGEIFRLGRLQFRPVKNNGRVPSGEWILETHIPQGEPLDPQKCLKSFAMAKEFFPKYLPEVKAEYFDCHSWLLNPNFTYLMGENSNIVQFGKLWVKKRIDLGGSTATISRVFGFGFKPEDLPNAPEDTRLQRKVKEFLLNGGDLSNTYAYRAVDAE